MRLLKIENGTISLTRNLPDHDIPWHSYAILSHTWGNDGDEVSFDDMLNATGKSKPGYQKILFCAEQAAHDGWQHF